MSNVNKQREIQVRKESSPITSDSTPMSYTIRLMGENAEISQAVRSFYTSLYVESKPVTFHLSSLLQDTKVIDKYKEPLHIHEEISAEEWKTSLNYNDNEVERLLGKILEDFDLEINNENTEWLKREMKELVSVYEAKHSVQLTEEMSSMINKLIVRIVHDRLCVKKLIT